VSQIVDEETSARTAEVCPVCRWPDSGAEVCGVCGWQLVGDYVLGPVTEAAERDLRARLTAARHRFGLRAAVRAAGPAGERDWDKLRQLIGLIWSDGRPAEETIRTVAEEIDAAGPPLTEKSDGIGFALTRLAAGLTDAIAFMEVGVDALTVQTLICGPTGAPKRLVGDRLPWTEFLPLLPAEDDLRHLRMAGDIGPMPGDDRNPGEQAAPADLLALVREAVGPVLGRLMTAARATVAASLADGQADTSGSFGPVVHRMDAVLVRRTYCWPVLDAAIAQVRTYLRPVADIVIRTHGEDLAGVIDRVSAHAPLRYGYDLVLAEVDGRSGLISIEPYPLFPAGAVASSVPPVPVAVAVARPLAANRVALPVVARRTPAADYRNLAVVAADRPLAAMRALDGTVEGPVDLTIELASPRDVKMTDARRLVGSSTGLTGWPDLLDGVPTHLPATQERAGRAMDLVLLIELGGGLDTVRSRVQLARDVIDEVRTVPGLVQIAVLGYRDHFGRHHVDAIGRKNEEDEALVVGGKLTTPDRAWAMLKSARRWRAVPVVDDLAAPVEDALQCIITDPDWKWHGTARHVLLTIGGRPPHPVKVDPLGSAMLPCPHRWSWRDSLAQLHDRYAVECFAVLDRRAAPGYGVQAWRQLGERGLYDASSVTAEQIVRDAADLPRVSAAKLCLATRVRAAAIPGS
jgi:hypothetical protein